MKWIYTLTKIWIPVTLALAVAISFSSSAQTEAETFTAKNAVYLDLGGNAGQYAFTLWKSFPSKRENKAKC